MEYTMLLWPHANVRYQAEAARLALAELRLMLAKIQPGAECSPCEEIGMPALRITLGGELSPGALTAIRTHSLLYGLFRRGDGDALLPLAGRSPACLGEDLPGILKYKGKTNELFTAMALNLALFAGNFWPRAGERLSVLDPMCGKGTALFVAANRGFDASGGDVDKNELAEAERFFKKYLEYHRVKHAFRRESLTLGGGKSAPCADFRYAAESCGPGEERRLRLAQMDAADVRRAFGPKAFHAIVCDLPYGVQHAPRGGGLEAVLDKSLPGWLDSLKPGGTCAISFNAATLPAARLRKAMERAGFQVLSGGEYDGLEHWVEQAVTRDVVVGARLQEG